MKDFKKLYYLLVLMGFIFTVACESSDSSKSEISNELSPSAEKLEVMQNQINLGLAQQSSWQKHWSAQLGSFDAGDFELAMTDTIDPMEMPEKNPILPEDPLYPYQLPHPEGNGTIDIYSYKVEAQESLERPYLNPDSEVIWYRSDGMKERLLFIGPSGSFEEGMWLSSVEFLVFGFFQEEEGFRPIIWLLDLENHTFSQFKMNQVVKDYQQESYLNLKLKTVDLI
jgi:hypothetical protein